MKLNLKKVLPIAAIGLMAGITFAHAATLSDWPAPFVAGGQADVTVVVGADAAASDSIAASDFTAALQAALGGAGGEQVVEGEAVLIEASGNDFNYGEDAYDIMQTLGEDDLPTILADGRYRESKGNTENDETYTQILKFSDNTVSFVFDAEDESPEQAGSYIYIDDDNTYPAYTYVLEFDNPIEYDTTSASTITEDFKLTKLSMFGREYTIVDAADKDGDNIVDELELMAGIVKAQQMEYSTETYTLGDKTYEVKVDIISDTSESVQFTINGETTDELYEGDTYELEDGTVIGVVDVLPNEGNEMQGGEGMGNDIVTFYLGAEKILLKDGSEVEINGEDVDGSEVTFTASNAGELESIKIEYTPEDPIYLAEGEEWTDPVLGRFKYSFSGVEKDPETLTTNVGKDSGKFVFNNNAGTSVTLEVLDLDTSSPSDGIDETVMWGDDNVGSYVYVSQDGQSAVKDGGNYLIADGDYCGVTSEDVAGQKVKIEDCEGVKLLVVGTGGEVHIVEVTNIEDPDGTWGNGDEIADLKDLTKGKTYDNEKLDGSAINLGSFATIKLTAKTVPDNTFGADADANPELVLEATDINTWNGGDSGWADFETDKGAEIDIEFDGAEANVYIANGDGNDLMGGAPDIAWEYDDDTNGDLEITADPGSKLTWVDENEDSDYDMALDAQNWGAIFKWDAKDSDDLTLEYPAEEAIAKFYVAEELASIPELAMETGTPGATLGSVVFLDTELTDELKAKNLIVVGGSAVNRVAAELLGLPYPSYGPTFGNVTGVTEEGKAILKMFDNPYAADKVALLVAGWSATDTRRAATALIEQIPGLEGKTEAVLDTSSATAVVLE